MKSAQNFALCLLILSFISGTTMSQNISGVILNYNENPVVPVPGIEIYFDNALKDTTNAQGGFGFPTAIERYDSPIIPTTFSLKLFPNPFNPSTILEYTVPYQGDVTIAGYNILGQEIFTEKHENQITGTYALTFDASKYNLGSQPLIFRVIIDPKDKSKGPLVEVRKGVYLK